ncbi:MAG: hypothetical protein Q8P32_00310 [Candidatus Komeilibacteria bacterium]|nr:hypothetical protein [Candidatus Komeilibacteria bacterium]
MVKQKEDEMGDQHRPVKQLTDASQNAVGGKLAKGKSTRKRKGLTSPMIQVGKTNKKGITPFLQDVGTHPENMFLI